jgi:hypothetical protein
LKPISTACTIAANFPYSQCPQNQDISKQQDCSLQAKNLHSTYQKRDLTFNNPGS